jgi:signal transduction histidine kinase
MEDAPMTTGFSSAVGQLVSAEDRQGGTEKLLLLLVHELRGSLAPLRYAARLLRHATATDGATAREITASTGDVVERQTAVMAALIDDVLEAHARHTTSLPMRFGRLDLCALVHAAAADSRLAIAARRHVLDVGTPNDPVFVQGDPARLRQVLLNLLANAAKYTDEGGRIRICVACTDGVATVTVTDDGIGMSPAQLASIFELYEQAGRGGGARACGGLGIGLYLARQIVETHGGGIVASSAGVGCGSTFVVTLPPVHREPWPRDATASPYAQPNVAS